MELKFETQGCLETCECGYSPTMFILEDLKVWFLRWQQHFDILLKV